MKLFDNVGGVGYIAYAIMKIDAYRKKIENAKAANEPECERELICEVCHLWADMVTEHFQTTINVKNPQNLPEEGPAVYVSNHQSYADILAALKIIKHQTGFVAKAELKKVPILASWIERIGSLFLVRSDAREALRVIGEGANMIKNGYSLVIFPEGTRSHCAKMGEFKAGSLKLATKARAKIVPLTINGSYKMFEEKNDITKGVTIEVTVHEPIETAAMSREDLAGLSEHLEAVIRRPLEEAAAAEEKSK